MSKKKYVTVTKKFILDALAVNFNKDLLKPMSFFDYDSNNIEEFKECSVCAVGAIFREALAPVKNMDKLYDHVSNATENCCSSFGSQAEKDALEYLDKKDYLSALSVFFEGMSGDYETTREFVRDNFPGKIQLNINGFKLSPKLAGKTLHKEPAAKKVVRKKAKR